MRVFVTGTGRCGTVSLATALRNATNYTVGHETETSDCIYPDWHIEVNPMLRIRLDEVHARYPRAQYVHLKRDQEKVAESYIRIDQGKWLWDWWIFHATVKPMTEKHQAMIAVREMRDQCHRAIQRVALGGGNVSTFAIEDWRQWFPKFWHDIGAQGDLQAALTDMETPRNTGVERGEA